MRNNRRCLYKPLAMILSIFISACSTTGPSDGEGGDSDNSDIFLYSVIIGSGIYYLSKKFSEKSESSSVSRYEHQENILYHVHEKLYRIGQEDAGYGLYTYVLLGSVPDGPDEGSIKRIKRIYSAVLTEVQLIKNSKSVSGHLDKRHTNIFYVPAKYDDQDMVRLSSYNYDLSFHILSELSISLRNSGDLGLWQRLLDRSGPFLVTTASPWLDSSLNMATPVLVVDMSNVHVDMVKEIVDVYKKRITNKGTVPFRKLENLQMTFIDKILHSDDVIHLMKSTFFNFKGKEN